MRVTLLVTWQKPQTGALGAPSTVSPNAKTLCIKDRKHLEKLLTCFSCLKDKAQIKASLGLHTFAALATCLSADRMYQAALSVSSGQRQTPAEELQQCTAPAPFEL